jgi:hypothetical protein
VAQFRHEFKFVVGEFALHLALLLDKDSFDHEFELLTQLNLICNLKEPRSFGRVSDDNYQQIVLSCQFDISGTITTRGIERDTPDFTRRRIAPFSNDNEIPIEATVLKLRRFRYLSVEEPLRLLDVNARSDGGFGATRG